MTTAYTRTSEGCQSCADNQRAAAPSLVQEALAAVGDDSEAATQWLIDKALNDKRFLREHLSDVVRRWAYGEVRAHYHQQRVVVTQAADAGRRNTIALHVAAKREVERLMNLPLWGTRRPLGEATPSEVRDSARHYKAQSSRDARQARFQFSVALAAEEAGAHIIADVMGEAELQTIWENTDA